MNQFGFLISYEDIKIIKKKIREKTFVSLEEYTGKTREELEAFKLGICDRYNDIIEKLKKSDFTLEELKQLFFSFRDFVNS